MFVSPVVLISKSRAAIESGEYVYPIVAPFVRPGSAAYFTMLVFQDVSVYNAALLHMGADCFICSIIACIVFQTNIVGHRFSRLGHVSQAEKEPRRDFMKEIIEFAQLQLENEKYSLTFKEIKSFKVIISHSITQEFEQCFELLWSHIVCSNNDVCIESRFKYCGNAECM